MSYLSQISVTDAKDYLRLDGTNLDTTLELLIEAACVHFERETNHLIYQREKTYPKGRIYDFPFTLTEDQKEFVTDKSLYFVTQEEITLNVGYASGELPKSIKNCILDLVMLDFYNTESDESTLRRRATHRTINDYKRFIF